MGGGSDIHQNLRWFIDSVPDAVLVSDSDGRIVLANARLAQLFGYSHDEIIGLAVEALIPPRLRDSHLQLREAYSREPRDRPMGTRPDIIALRSDGSEFRADIQLRTRDSPAGPLTIAVIRDLTNTDRRREVEELLDSIRENAAAAGRLLPSSSSAHAALEVVEGAALRARQLMRELFENRRPAAPERSPKSPRSRE